MTYVVMDACIKCKYMDCVEVCPVDCFYEGDNMLVIHPDECIDCGGLRAGVPLSTRSSRIPKAAPRNGSPSTAITRPNGRTSPSRAPRPPDADAFAKETGKLQKYFKPDPGQGG